jgi:hypothetical protein
MEYNFNFLFSHENNVTNRLIFVNLNPKMTVNNNQARYSTTVSNNDLGSTRAVTKFDHSKFKNDTFQHLAKTAKSQINPSQTPPEWCAIPTWWDLFGHTGNPSMCRSSPRTCCLSGSLQGHFEQQTFSTYKVHKHVNTQYTYVIT